MGAMHILILLARLLQAPFDFSQAFDQALKNIVVAIPNRPAKESSDDAVGDSHLHNCID